VLQPAAAHVLPSRARVRVCACHERGATHCSPHACAEQVGFCTPYSAAHATTPTHLAHAHTHTHTHTHTQCTRATHTAQVVYGHLDDPEHQELQRGVSYLKLRPGV
jgi:hypothetical protein